MLCNYKLFLIYWSFQSIFKVGGSDATYTIRMASPGKFLGLKLAVSKCFIISVGEKKREKWFISLITPRGQAIHIIASIGGKRERRKQFQRQETGPSILTSLGDSCDYCYFYVWHLRTITFKSTDDHMLQKKIL